MIGDENFSEKFLTHINSKHLTFKVCKNSLRFCLTGLNYNILVNCSPQRQAEARGEGAPSNLIIKLRTLKYGLLLIRLSFNMNVHNLIAVVLRERKERCKIDLSRNQDP